MKKTSLLFFIFASFLSYSQKKETIAIKKQGELFFFRTGLFKDSIITKNISDTFFVKLSGDKKESIEIKLINATFTKANNEHLFKLLYTPGMKYRMIYANSVHEGITLTSEKEKQNRLEVHIATDGANTSGKKEIVIEIWDTKTDKLLLSNVFTYKEK
ncbi:MAG: hypothetical protein IPJ60_01125 [Sphingobacteriaceae bacterium]|nr:hypothetical protein [Sphingobacteriaceae bacterium]